MNPKGTTVTHPTPTAINPLGNDYIAEWICSRRVADFRDLGIKNLESLTSEAASLEIVRLNHSMHIDWEIGYYGKELPCGHWHCHLMLASRRTNILGHGATMRGAIIMALTELQWQKNRQTITS